MRHKLLIVLVAAMLVATITSPVGAQGPSGATPPPPLPTGEGLHTLFTPDFDVRGGFEQLFVTEAEPGDPVRLFRWRLRRGAWRLDLVELATVDDLGSAQFRELDPGYYLVTTGGRIHWAERVRVAENSTPPQSFYDNQELAEGFQYIETRDGTTLSAYVVLPGPIEDGPYPTVVEYSGYDPSNPVGGLGSLGGGIDPTPFCGELPILCKAPAQPSSLLAGLFGYAVVGVNIRGTGCSGGAYDFFEEMQVLDGYDVVEAVGAQSWVKDNQVGMVGLSYPGISQLFVARSQPPSLGAIAPLSVYADTATGILAPGGLLNTGFATSWADNLGNNARPYGPAWVNEVIDDGDTECDRNQQLRLQNIDATEKARANPFYTNKVAGPLDIREWVGDIDVPVFLASGFGDEQTGPSFGDLLDRFDSSPSVRAIIYNGLHADGFSPQVLREWAAFLDIYIAEEVPSFPPALQFLTPIFTDAVFGGQVPLPPDRWTDVTTHAQAQARWESEDEIRILFENGAGGAAGLPTAAWEHTTNEWPPTNTEVMRYWFGADGSLADQAEDPAGTGVPFHPNPAVSQTNFHVGGNIWGPNPDFDWVPQPAGQNARFQSPPLTNDIVLAGTASVDLWLRTDATDAELETVLTEVRPDGQELRVQSGVLQASYRHVNRRQSTALQPVQYGRERTHRPLVPGEWTEVRVQIPAFAHAFRAGSSIRVTINTPGGDHVRWEFELDGPGAEATHVIGTGVDHPSSIALPLVSGLQPSTPLPPCGSLRGQPCRPAPPIDQLVVSENCPAGCSTTPPDTVHTERPASVVFPTDYDPAREYPLVVMLHGFTMWGDLMGQYMGAYPQVDQRDFIMVLPDGTPNAQGQRFWNSGAGCCGGGVDDVSYVTELIEDTKSTYNIDPDRVYLWGYSNGGFMALTMACKASEHITAIASLAGSSFGDPARCEPRTEPVSVLQIHGDNDQTVSYPGTVFPGAVEIHERHADFLGCRSRVGVGDDLDLVANEPGNETAVQFRDRRCAGSTSAELWTMQGVGHIPNFSSNFAPAVLDWLLAQRR
ncbi:MAG: CocE/NonD family hydrolase [Acidimicrobiales bacterium]